jgi:type II secretory pathway pseudopilin PulG
MNKQKGFTLVEGLLIVLIVSFICFAGYYVWNQNQEEETETFNTVQQENQEIKEENNKADDTVVEESVVVDNMFDKDKVTAGDKIGAMTAAMNFSSNNVLFEDKVTVTGSYFVLNGDELLGSIWCLQELDEVSLSYMPKEINDTRDVWFCFNNDEKASSLLGDNDLEKVTVTIDDYYINLKQSSVYNTATLVEVKQ